MKPKDKILTYEQVRELQWFGRNCTGLRPEFYAFVDDVNAYKAKIDRLCETAERIEKFMAEFKAEEPSSHSTITKGQNE